LVTAPDVELVISGHSPLGGIDIWAIQIAEAHGIPTLEYAPRKLTWEGGYKQRNLQIADTSDLLACITLRSLPDSFRGMRFPLCYHCGTRDHVKSGGCWTMKQARRLGKATELVIIE
jgi:hypothetical protein